MRTRTLLALPLLLAAGCASDDPAAERLRLAERGEGEVTIAVVWPWEARSALRFGDGVEMAVNEINEGGGIDGRPLRVLREDDGESVDRGRLVAQRIARDPRVSAVIGHLQSYVTVPAAAIYDLAGLPLVAPAATDPELTRRGYRRVFRATFDDEALGRRMAEFVAARGHRRVAVYYVRNPYGRGLANAFEERATELGVRTVARQSYDPAAGGASRVAEQVLDDWTGLEPDAVFLAGEVPHGAHFVAAARRRGLRVPIFGGDAMGVPETIRIAGDAAEGLVAPTAFHPDAPHPAARRFVERFRDLHGEPPDAAAALGYDAVHLVADAMRRAGTTDPEKVALALHATRGWEGATGTFSYDERGDPVDRPILLMEVRDGRWTHLPDTASPAP